MYMFIQNINIWYVYMYLILITYAGLLEFSTTRSTY